MSAKKEARLHGRASVDPLDPLLNSRLAFNSVENRAAVQRG